MAGARGETRGVTSTGVAVVVEAVHVGGRRVGVRRAGRGEPVLLLHGWPTSSYLWRATLPALAAVGRSAIAPDLPGFGESEGPAPGPLTLDVQARWLDDMLEAVGIARTALVLHDIGGSIGLLWAVRHPARVSALVILDTPVAPRHLPVLRVLLAAARRGPVARALTSPAGLRALMRIGTRRMAGLPPDARDAYLGRFREPGERGVLVRALTDPRPREFDEIVDGLPGLSGVPTLVVWADRDLVLPRAEGRRIARLIPGAREATVRRAGHFLPDDRPEEVAGLVGGFLRQGRPPTELVLADPPTQVPNG